MAPMGGNGGPAGRIPPHNLEAEESVLGAMLLSRDAIATAMEICKPEDFYKSSHGHIFSAITSLFSQGEPADWVTVTEELRRRGLLETIGDPSVFVSLQANTPSIGNAEYYARIIEELALLRRLVSVAGEITELGYSLPEDVSDVLDRAESLVFEVSQRRVVDSMTPLRDLLGESLDHLEQLFTRGESPAWPPAMPIWTNSWPACSRRISSWWGPDRPWARPASPWAWWPMPASS
jgi:replicative DNA helicase